MAKGQVRSNKETRKPKKDKVKPSDAPKTSFTTQLKQASDTQVSKGKSK